MVLKNLDVYSEYAVRRFTRKIAKNTSEEINLAFSFSSFETSFVLSLLYHSKENFSELRTCKRKMRKT